MVQVLDSTLREGEQTPGVYFSPHIKLAIADLLDRLGVGIIEAGHPAVSKNIELAVRQIAGRRYRAAIGAHARSLERDIDLALDCGVGFLGVFYCVSNERAEGVFRRSVTSGIEQIVKVIAYAKERNPSLVIRYTPEDTVRSQFENVVAASVAAAEAGADVISVADTTGCMNPYTRSMYDYVSRLVEALGRYNVAPQIAVHCHNDRGLALANALDGYRAGARIIDASVMGLGERAGIVDLAELLVVLAGDFELTNGWQLTLIPELYNLVSRRSGVPIPAHRSIVGGNAFTHCAGVHTHAAAIDPLHYESLDPAIVGRTRAFSLDHMSGISSVRRALDQLGLDCDAGLMDDVLAQVKSVGETGRTVDLEELRQIVDWCIHHRVMPSTQPPPRTSGD